MIEGVMIESPLQNFHPEANMYIYIYIHIYIYVCVCTNTCRHICMYVE